MQLIARPALLVLIGLSACELYDPIGRPPTDGFFSSDAGPLHTQSVNVSINGQSKIDVLFMIDNSHSMAEKQAQLQANFPKLKEKLDSLAAANHPAWYHIGVVTSDLGAGPTSLGNGSCTPGGDGGKLQMIPKVPPAGLNCVATGSDTVTKMSANYIDLNQLPSGGDNLPAGMTLDEMLSCMTSVGDTGCGYEHQLESVYRALHDLPAENQGFLRTDAALAVILLTDEDDCSAPPNTDLFDPAQLKYGVANSSFRCTQFGIQYGKNPPVFPLPSAGGVFSDVAPADAAVTKLWATGRYIDFFTKPKSSGGLKDDPSIVFLAGIAGPVINNVMEVDVSSPCVDNMAIASCPFVVPSCNSAIDPRNESGTPAVRISAVVNSAINHASESICDTDYSPSVDSLFEQINASLNAGCLSSPIDYVNGFALCSVIDMSDTDSLLPACNGANPDSLPCWEIVSDSNCPAVFNPIFDRTERLALRVCRDGSCTQPSPPPTGVYTVASCELLLPSL